MNDKLVIVECKKEENLRFNDNISIAEVATDMFDQNKHLENVEIFLLDDDYIDFLAKRGINDNPVSREEYIRVNKYKDFNQSFINSEHSDLIDSALIPVAIFNNDMENSSFEIRLTDDKRKKLNEYLTIVLNHNTAADPVFAGTDVKRIYTNDYILSIDERIFDNEDYLIEEIIDGANYGITKQFKRLTFRSDVLVTIGFIYVIAMQKIPRVITRKIAATFSSDNDSIVSLELDAEKIEEILKTDEYEPCPFCKYLIYPEELEETVNGWADQVSQAMEEEMASFEKFEEISSMHTKKGKK